MKRKVISIIMCTLLCVLCMAGCGSSSSDASSDENTQTLDMSTGIVKSIDADNNQIVLNVMDMSKFEGEAPTDENGDTIEPPTGENGEKPEMPTGENGEAPSKPSGDPPSGENGEKPEMPTGENGEAPSKPDDEAPDFGQMEEKTYTLSASVYIQDENGSQITLADIEEGAFVQFTVENDEIATLSLKKMDKNMEKPSEE